jgi:hypothetical protein
VENKSSKSTDWSVCDGSWGDFDGISRTSMKGSWISSLFDNDRDNDDDADDTSSSGSCSWSDIDGVDIDDERCSSLGESIHKKNIYLNRLSLTEYKHYALEFDRYYWKKWVI